MADQKLRVKYLAGWLKLESMDNMQPWHHEWRKSVLQAEKENCELVVFKIPRDRKGNANAIAEVEQFLQEKFGS